jgi:hypothetical protein
MSTTGYTVSGLPRMATREFDAARLVIIIGSPRSGTTWLSRMLAEHPAIAALPHELTLFSEYLAPLSASYARESARLAKGLPVFGLPPLVPKEEFDATLRRATRQIYARVASSRVGASMVLDKHPGYSHHLSLIEALAPGCRYIHLVRDGRAAIASMLNAPGIMGRIAGSVQSAALEWALCTARAEAHAATVGPGRILTVRYEELLAATPEALERVFTFCGLEADPQSVQRIAEQHHHRHGLAAHGAARSSGSPAGDAWKRRFRLRDRYWIHRIAGEQLMALGHAQEGWWANSSLDRLRMALFPLRVKVGETLKQLRRIWGAPITRAAGYRENAAR